MTTTSPSADRPPADTERETPADTDARQREQRARLNACKRRVKRGHPQYALAVIRLYYRDKGGIEASLFETPHQCADCETGKWSDDRTLKVASPQWGELCPPCFLSRIDHFETGGRNRRVEQNTERFVKKQETAREHWAARHRKRARRIKAAAATDDEAEGASAGDR